MRLLVEYTSHGRGPAAPQTYTTTLDIVDDVAERLLKAKTPYTFRERKRCTREALILAFLIYDTYKSARLPYEGREYVR